MIADQIAYALEAAAEEAAAYGHLDLCFQVDLMAVPLENGGAIMVATLLTRAKSSLLGQHVWDLATVPADALLAELETEGGPRRCLFDVVQRVEAARAQHARGGN